MRFLQPLDAHAHINTTIPNTELQLLEATVFAMTRNLDEATEALSREDNNILWGVGCHPGLVKVQKNFEVNRFSKMIEKTALVGEVGLDGKSRAPIDVQLKNLRDIFEILQHKPRIVSLHSSAATELLIQVLEEIPVKGAILPWWIGDKELTKRALSLGCYFSFNASSLRYSEMIASIPADRVLTETDHPFGNRWSASPQRPGSLSDVEVALASIYGIETIDMRRQIWRNFGSIVKETTSYKLLPNSIRTTLAAAI
jgi:TatD DNase family protein